jgi:iron complex outermembrane recepter protein
MLKIIKMVADSRISRSATPIICCLSSLASPFAFSSPAGTAASTDSAAPPSDQLTLTEIVVTAQKRSERLQDVPVSVSTVDSSTMVRQHLVSISDYLGQVPGLAADFSDHGGVSLAIRGITTGTGGGNPTVGVTIDDVPIDPSAGFTSAGVVPELDPGILKGVEVLRGPQGTLYGASSMGGLLKYTTAPPDLHDTHGQWEVDGLSVDNGGTGYSARASVTTPIVTDALAFSASGFFRRDPGYVSDTQTQSYDANSTDTSGGRLATLWQINGATSLQLAALYQHVKGDGSSTVFVDDAMRPIHGLSNTFIAGAGSFERSLQLYSANLNSDFGWATLNSVTGYSIFVGHYTSDGSAQYGDYTYAATGNPNLGTLLVDTQSTHKLSQEFRLSSPTDQTISWLTGLFYTRERNPTFVNLWGSNPNTGELLSQVLPDDIERNDYTEYAAFADVTYRIGDQVDVQLGARYSDNEQHYHEVITGPLFSPPNPPYDVYAESSGHATTYLFTPRWRISTDLMTYLRIASGYRPGGPNPGAFFGFPSTYAADTTTSYEAGLKGEMFGDTLQYQADVYYINWNKIQLLQTDPTTQFEYFTNGAKARSQGLELTMTAAPMRGLTITPTVGFTDATLRQNLTGGLVGFSGDRLPYTAKWSASLDAEQKFSITGTVTGYMGGQLRYLTDRPSDFASTPTAERLDLPAYALLDLRAGLSVNDWKVGIFAQNVTNRLAILGASPQIASGLTGINYAVVQRPRTIGMSVSRNF